MRFEQACVLRVDDTVECACPVGRRYDTAGPLKRRTTIKNKLGFNLITATAAIGLVGLTATSSACLPDDSKITEGPSCDGLDVTVPAQLSVKVFADAANALEVAALKVEEQWMTVCNHMNAEIGAMQGSDAKSACGNFAAFFNGKTVNVSIDVKADCIADVNAEADCSANCNAKAGCDVAEKCEPGKLAVQCNGTCSGSCDVAAPAFMCNGSCNGECTAAAAVACSGECSGSCDAPTWSGTCDAGCAAMFDGTCGGNCNGACDGNAMNGPCAGRCTGSCDAKATGSCKARCVGQLSGGQCTGMCTGKCNVADGAACNGTCNGTCSYTPGTGTCQGTCHGMCSAQVKPPRCEGKLDCSAAAAECNADCHAQASANFVCPQPQVNLACTGVGAAGSICTALIKYQADIGAAWAATFALKDSIAAIAGKTAAAFQSLGATSASSSVCFVEMLQVAEHASASINVSVNATASIQGKAI